MEKLRAPRSDGSTLGDVVSTCFFRYPIDEGFGGLNALDQLEVCPRQFELRVLFDPVFGFFANLRGIVRDRTVDRLDNFFNLVFSLSSVV